MTYKNTKTILFASLIAAMILSFSGMNMIEAAANEKANDKVEKKSTLTKEQKEDLKRVTEIMTKRLILETEKRGLEKSASTDDKIVKLEIEKQIDDIDKEFNKLQKKSQERYHVTPERQAELSQIRENTDFSGIPLVGMGIDGIKKQLSFEILDSKWNRALEDKYRKQLHELIPSEKSFTIKFRDTPTDFLCGSRQNCIQLFGGTQIEAHTSGNCTLGYKAIRLGVIGFVMAGHCADGDVGESVYHPTGNRRAVGIVIAELKHSNTSCDCAFVGTSSSDVSSKIYFGPFRYYQPQYYTSTTNQAGQYVAMSGVGSGIEYGVVNDIDFTANYNSGTVKHLVKSTLDSTYGDSGAPVTRSTGKSIFGIVSGGQEFWGETYHVPVQRVMTELGAYPVS